MPARKTISKKTRFEVFKRDSFICTYCGATPPRAILEIDHISPVSDGGNNNINNLTTACFDCNRGKSDRLLSSVPESLSNKAKRIKEQEEQLFEYNKILQSQRSRIIDDAFMVAEIFKPKCSTEGFQTTYINSIKKFVDLLGLYPVIDSAEIANNKFYPFRHKTFIYFCGIQHEEAIQSNSECYANQN